MEQQIAIAKEIDARGLNCPMPLVRARQALGELNVGDVLKVVSTDKGSILDFKGWAQTASNIELVGQEESDVGGKAVFIHFVRKSA
jgi:tRNA 2-thiouridine synthesizing protein A